MPPSSIVDDNALRRRDFLGWELALPLLVVIMMLLSCALILKIPFFWALIAGWLLAFGIAWRAGYHPKELLTVSWIGIWETRLVIIVLAMIGALIALWFLSGTIPILVYHSLAVVIPKYLPLWAFVAAALVSLLLGTAIGTLGTVCIALMAVGQSLDVSSPLLAGALVSDAFVGDRTSLVSSAFHLLSQTTGVSPAAQVKVLTKTTLVALAVCVLFFLIAGLTLPPHLIATTETVLEISTLIQETWQIDLWAFVPAIVLLVMALGRLPVLWCLTGGIISAIFISTLHQGLSLTETAQAIFTGYQPESGLQGMLVDAAIIEAVAATLRRHSVANLVIDPVMIAKSGDKLLADEAHDAMRRQLLPLATVVTPNIPEAQVLTGITVRTKDDMIKAARKLQSLGCPHVLITGGHLKGDAADDLFLTKGDVRWLPATKIPTVNTHGTGCTLSAAIAAGLASGLRPMVAVKQAKRFITDAIAQAPDLGGGHGPTNHLAWLGKVAPDEGR